MLARARVSWQDALPAPRQIPSRPQSLTAAHALVRQILSLGCYISLRHVLCEYITRCEDVSGSVCTHSRSVLYKQAPPLPCSLTHKWTVTNPPVMPLSVDSHVGLLYAVVRSRLC